MPKDPFQIEYRIDSVESRQGEANLSLPIKVVPPEVEILRESDVNLYKQIIRDSGEEIDAFSEVKLIVLNHKLKQIPLRQNLVDLNDFIFLTNIGDSKSASNVTFIASEDMLKVSTDESLYDLIDKSRGSFQLSQIIHKAINRYSLEPISESKSLQKKIHAILSDPALSYFYHRKKGNKDNVLVTIWDFDDQKIYHGIQKLFFTKRTIYLIIANEIDSSNDIFDKIQSIKILAGESPVILLYKHDTSRTDNPIFLEFERRIPNLSILSILDESKESFVELRKLIEKLIKNSEEVNAPLKSIFPRNWIDLRYKINLQRQNKDILTLEDFVAICAQCKIIKDTEIELLLEVLHQLGVIIYFKNDSALKDFVLLNHSWINRAIELLVQNPETKINEGLIRENEIFKIWDTNKQYKYRTGLLLSIIAKKILGFCFEIEPGVYLIPELISKNNSSKQYIKKKEDIHFVVEYDPLLPIQIFHQLLALMQRDMYDSEFWSTGIIFQIGEALISIDCKLLDNQIVVRIQGDDLNKKIEAQGVVKDRLMKINNIYTNIKPYILIPCKCSNCSSSSMPHYFDYDKIKNRMKVKNSNLIECPLSYEDVNILYLLGTQNLPNKLELIEHVNKGHLPVVFDALMLEFKGQGKWDENQKDIAGLSSRYSQNEKLNMEGTIDKSDYSIEKNKITKALIHYLDKI